jgi:hypothetical protein
MNVRQDSPVRSLAAAGLVASSDAIWFLIWVRRGLRLRVLMESTSSADDMDKHASTQRLRTWLSMSVWLPAPATHRSELVEVFRATGSC